MGRRLSARPRAHTRCCLVPAGEGAGEYSVGPSFRSASGSPPHQVPCLWKMPLRRNLADRKLGATVLSQPLDDRAGTRETASRLTAGRGRAIQRAWKGEVAMLTAEQRTAFDEQGLVRIPGAFSRAEAAEMEAQVWTALGRKYGACRTDPSTWPPGSASGLQPLKGLPAFQAIGGSATVEALDAVLGRDRWKKPRDWGQFLVSFPTAEGWTVPTGWHTDFAFLAPADAVFGALVFSFLADVAPGGGGTAVLAGSHRLIRRFVATQAPALLASVPKSRVAFMRSDPWLEALASNGGEPDRVARFMEDEHRIAGIPVRVHELTGEAGDIILGHPWLLHSISSNGGNRPRFMCVQRLRLNGIRDTACPTPIPYGSDDLERRQGVRDHSAHVLFGAHAERVPAPQAAPDYQTLAEGNARELKPHDLGACAAVE
jgi:Phytanoyl-CoA dioxygenase (PhyH)